jgi:hypothetical protein
MVPVKDEDNAARARPGIASVRQITRTDTRRVSVPRRLDVDISILHKLARNSNTFIFHGPSLSQCVRNQHQSFDKYISLSPSAIRTMSGRSNAGWVLNADEAVPLVQTS